jgi:Glycosyl transferase family 2
MPIKLTTQNLATKKSLSLYTPLPYSLHPANLKATLPENLNDLRLFGVIDWVLRLLKLQNRGVQLTFSEIGEKADLAIAFEEVKATQVAKVGTVSADSNLIKPNQDFFNVLRYYLAGYPYSQPLEIKPEALEASALALQRLKEYAHRLQTETGNPKPNPANLNSWRKRFVENLENNLDTVRALPVIWLMLQANLPAADKLALLTEFDHLLNLGIIPDNPLTQRYREQFNQTAKPAKPAFDPSNLKAKPVKPANSITGVEGGKKAQAVAETTGRKKIQSSRELNSHLREADRFDFTVSLIAHDNLNELKATINSLLAGLLQTKRKAEIVIVDMNSQTPTANYLETLHSTHRNLKVVWAAQNLGEAAGRNIALKQAYGKYLLALTAGTIVKGDLFEALLSEINPPERALYGLNPVKVAQDNYTPLPLTAKRPLQKDEALDGFLLCWERKLATEVGFMDEHFRHPYALGLDYSYNFYDKTLKVIALSRLHHVLELPQTFPDYGFDPTKQKPKNWGLFLRSWSDNS